MTRGRAAIPTRTAQALALNRVQLGSHVALEANPAYYGGAPKLRTVVFKVIPDVNTVVAQLRTGELDLAVVTANHRDTLASAPNLAFKVTVLPSTFYLAMSKRVKGYPDLSVRDALPWAHQIAVP